MANTPLKNGVIMGVVLSVASLGMTLISPDSYVSYGRAILFIVALFFMRKIGKDEKELNEGILNFGETFKAIFIGSLIAYFMLNVTEYISYNYIKPELNELTREIAIKSADISIEFLADLFGFDQATIDEMKLEAKKETTVEKTRRSPNNAGILLLSNIISPCILWGLILSIFVKSKN